MVTETAIWLPYALVLQQNNPVLTILLKQARNVRFVPVFFAVCRNAAFIQFLYIRYIAFYKNDSKYSGPLQQFGNKVNCCRNQTVVRLRHFKSGTGKDIHNNY